MAVLELVTTIPEVLEDLMRRRGLSERALATYMGVSPNAANAWARGLRTPDPEYCWKIAELAHLPVEEVMRIAGHLPPAEDAAPPPAIPPWLASVLSELDAHELGVVESTAHALLELRELRAAYEAGPPASPAAPVARRRRLPGPPPSG